MTTPYTRPTLTKQDEAEAQETAKALLRKYGMNNVTPIIAHLCLENVRLVREIEEHRAKLGIEPMKTFEVK